MNWLGAIIRGCYWLEGESVLDLGCGTLAPTGRFGSMHLAVDCFEPYRATLKASERGRQDGTRIGAIPEVMDSIASKSWDLVMLLDVIEHLDKPDAVLALTLARNIARCRVVIFTPDGPVAQGGLDDGHGHNAAQAHRCSFTRDELDAMGFETQLHETGNAQSGRCMGVLGVLECA